MAVLGLCFCARAFSSCGKWGPLFIAVRGPLIIAASPVAEQQWFSNFSVSQRVQKITWRGTSLVAQWLRIRLPMQLTRVRALVWEDPTCRGATKPVRHNY